MKRYLTIALALAILFLAVPIGGESQEAWASLSEIDLAWQVEGGSLLSEEIDAPATTVGLTWEGAGPDSAWFRVNEGGKWGGWAPLPIEDDHGPDPGTREAEETKPGSDLVWVGPVDGVQFQIRGGDETTRAALIDTTNRTKPLARQFGNLFTEPTAEAATALPGQPTIRPRSAWDPSGSCLPKAQADFGQVTHAFVHHTTGTNAYSAADVPSRILGICLFHINSRGWNDIGYNFLIDRFGVIWEGRAGGINKGVQGAHTAGFNSYSMGVAFIGDHSASGPTAAAETALVNLLAWKFGVHNVDPTTISTLVSKGSEKWPVGTPVALRPVSGHRDGQATSCPGEACYQRLPSLRSRVDAKWDQVPLTTYRSPSVGDFDGDGASEAAVFRRGTGVWSVTDTNGSTQPWATFATKTGWSSQVVGDFNGDGRDDIANFHTGNGTWWVSRSTGSAFATTMWADFSTASGWSKQIVGDFNGDGRDDIANFHPSNGTWWVSQSTGTGFTTKEWADFSTATGWTSQIVGDFNGDGRDDIANFHPSNGTWWLSLSTGSALNTSSWADFSTSSGWTIQIAGDFNGDGRDDIANRHSGNGTWWVSRSTGGTFSTSLWGTTQSLDHISLAWAQDIDNDGRTDIIAFDAYNGFIRRQQSTGSAFVVQSLADTPWRTTLGAGNNGDLVGSSGWIFFGQEFSWVRITGLTQAAATAQVMATLPR
jgi:hypothetical protein